jgi:hypothetical protein
VAAHGVALVSRTTDSMPDVITGVTELSHDVAAEFGSIGIKSAAHGGAHTPPVAQTSPGSWDRNHDTARGPGGPCSVAARSHDPCPRQVRRHSRRC